jgi:hypothetical protein
MEIGLGKIDQDCRSASSAAALAAAICDSFADLMNLREGRTGKTVSSPGLQSSTGKRREEDRLLLTRRTNA